MATKKIGDAIEWSSQSGGVWKTKKGVVIGIVLPWRDAYAIIEKYHGAMPKPSRVHSQKVSGSERYVIDASSGDVVHFYCPLVSVIDNQLARKASKKRGKRSR